jgi:hypothetical protein
MSNAEFLLKLALALNKNAAVVPALARETGEEGQVGNLLARDLAGAGRSAIQGEIANIGRLNRPVNQSFAARSFKTPPPAAPGAAPQQPTAGNTQAFRNVVAKPGPALPPVPAPVAMPAGPGPIATAPNIKMPPRVAFPPVPSRAMGKTGALADLVGRLGQAAGSAGRGLGRAVGSHPLAEAPVASRAVIPAPRGLIAGNEAPPAPAGNAMGTLGRAGLVGAAGLGGAAALSHGISNTHAPQTATGELAQHAGDAVSGAVSDPLGTAKNMAGQAGQYFQGLGSHPVDWMKAHPMGTAAGGLGAAALLTWLLSRKHRHNADDE